MATIPIWGRGIRPLRPTPATATYARWPDRVFTTLDFQGKIDGPLSDPISERADPETKARVSGDAFRRPDRWRRRWRCAPAWIAGSPLWSEYKKTVVERSNGTD